MTLARNVLIATATLFAAMFLFWITAPGPLKQNIIFNALAQVGCVPNPNLQGPPNMVNGCPIPVEGLNKLLGAKSTFFVVTAYGAKGDGSTNDSPAAIAALAACGSAGGGFVYFPPTGAAYRLASSMGAAPNGCQVRGMGGVNVPGLYDNTEAHWTASGSWLRCEDLIASCVQLAGTGSSIEGINFWYTQPTPGATTCASAPCNFVPGWTPTTYPYSITIPYVNNTGNWIENIAIINGYDCIDVEGTGNGISLMRSHIEHVLLNCFDRDIKMVSVDNTLSMFDVREDPIWFQGSLEVLNYTEGTAGHGIGWDVHYVANLQASHIEWFKKRVAILLTDGQANNGFGALAFAGANWQGEQWSFNEVCQAMAVAAADTHFAGGSAGNGVGWNVLHNVIAAADTDTSKASPQQCAAGKPFFDFGSDNVGVEIDGLNVAFADTIAKIGNGSSGYLKIPNVRAQKYSAFTAAQPAFIAGNGAYPDVHGDFLAVSPNSGAGPFLSGVPIAPFSILGEAQVGANVQQVASLSLGTLPASPSAAGVSRRWGFRKDTANEAGANAGSNLFIDRYADNGTFIDSPIAIDRATGQISVPDGFKLTLPTSPPSGSGAGYLCLDSLGQAYIKASCP